MRNQNINEMVNSLINTSVEDMTSSLNFYSYLNQEDVMIVALAKVRCNKRGEVTKVNILSRKLKKMQKDIATAKIIQQTFSHRRGSPA